MRDLNTLIAMLARKLDGEELRTSVRAVLSGYMLAATKAKADDARKLVQRELPRARALAKKVTRKKKAVSVEGLPEPLGDLTEMFTEAVREITADLQGGALSPEDWQAQFEILLARYQSAAFMAGANTFDLSDEMLTKVTELVGQQLGFLADFTVEISKSQDEWQSGWNARADSYAGGLKAPYWTGETKMLPLPSMPGDGNTDCLGNCKCKWRIEPVDEEAGDYDCYWELGQNENHCQLCSVSAREWKPFKIRGGMPVV